MNSSSKWKFAAIKELLESPLLNGYHQKGMQYGNGVLIVRMVDLYRGDTIDVKSLDRVEYPFLPSEDYKLAQGDILINRTSLKREGVGKAVLIPMPHEATYFDCSIIRARPNKSIIFPKFLLYALNSYVVRHQMMKIAKTATITTISHEGINKLQIPLPSMHTQHKVVEILEEADNLRKLRQQTDKKMKDLIPSLFVQIFGDPATNPKEWGKKKLKDVTISIKNGLFKRPNEFGSGVPLINVVDLFAEYKVDLTKLERVSATQEEIKKYSVVEGDLFFCRSSLKKEGVAKCVVALNLNEPTVFECHTIMVRLNKNALDPLFASIYLNHPGVRTYTIDTSQTATMTTVGQKDILRQKIFIPPIPLQVEFAKLVEDIEAEKARQAESRKKLDELFNSLMQRAFTGELVA